MKKYNITVNGNTYEVEVEEVGGVQSAAPAQSAPRAAAPSAPKAPAAPKAAPKAPAAKKSVPQGAEAVCAPMPGTVIDVKVSEGDMVNEGDIVLTLEAMKMENEIPAPKSGKVVAINVSKGATVASGDALISIE